MPHKDLVGAVEKANIDVFGWPIGVVLKGHPDQSLRPKPTPQGISSQVMLIAKPGDVWPKTSYDLWTMTQDGHFYLLKSLFEDERHLDRNMLAFDTRIFRTAEALLFCSRLYNALEVSPEMQVEISIRHGGLKGRTLASADRGRDLSFARTTETDEMGKTFRVRIGEIDERLIDLTKDVCAELFTQFELAEFADKIYEDIVADLLNG